MKPQLRPRVPNFSSGPCAKRPGWSPDVLKNACVGRAHRSADAKAKLSEVIDRSRAVLGMPADWRLGIVPGSDTGAMEIALWSMLGARGADMLAWEAFGRAWAADAKDQLRLDDVRVFEVDYGDFVDLGLVDFTRDVVFPWNGTTSGVRVPDGGWIAPDRDGLVICDATSAAFAMDLPWDRLDVVTWSWQKALGSEGAHGMLALSPRAVERVARYAPPWPVPKLFRIKKGDGVNEDLFAGGTLNTPSMLAVEDVLDALKWAENIGGLDALIARSEANLAAVAAWVGNSEWASFLARRPETRSCTSICLAIAGPAADALDAAARAALPKNIVALMAKEGAAYDIGSYRDAPPGLRIWGGATVDTADLEALLPWLDWAFSQIAGAPASAATA